MSHLASRIVDFLKKNCRFKKSEWKKEVAQRIAEEKLIWFKSLSKDELSEIVERDNLMPETTKIDGKSFTIDYFLRKEEGEYVIDISVDDIGFLSIVSTEFRFKL